MDAVYVSCNITPFAATAGAKTILKLITPTGFNIKIHEIGLSTDGVTSTAVPMTVDWGNSDETTAGTAGGSPTTIQIKGSAIAHGITLGANFTAEGTTLTPSKKMYVPQFMGTFIYQTPLGFESVSPAGLPDSFFVRVNVTANVNVLCWVVWSRA